MNDISIIKSKYDDSIKEGFFLPIEPLPIHEYYPTSAAQKRVYIQEQIEASTAYNMPCALLIRGELDVERLENSFRKLISRHDAFRTSFHFINGEIVQHVSDNVDFNIIQLKLQEVQLKEFLKECFIEFDLKQAPLLRAFLAHIGEQKYVLILDMHHIISDGVSVNVMIDELAEFYEGERPLDDINIQYKDYANWNNSLLNCDWMHYEEKYWLNVFSNDKSSLCLPVDINPFMVNDNKGGVQGIDISPPLVAKLKNFARKRRITTSTLFLSMYALFLCKCSGQDDVVVGTAVNGRRHPQVKKTIGYFVNTLPIRFQINPKMSFSDYLDYSMSIILNAYKNQDYPFDELVRRLEKTKEAERNTFLDAYFTFQSDYFNKNTFGNLLCETYPIEEFTAKYDFMMVIFEKKDEFRLEIEYRKSIFHEDTIKLMINWYLHLLLHGIENPQKPLSELSLVSQDEIYKLSSQNNFETKDRSYKSILAKFEEQVKRVPDRIAVTNRIESITYEALNIKSDNIAMVLCNQGVQLNTVVGILSDCSVNYIIAVLGVIKAGGAFLPIDKNLPESRVVYMLKDSNAIVLLSDGGANFVTDCKVLDIIECTQNTNNKNHIRINNGRDSLAYIIYTSGSTGYPKGIIVDHKALYNYLSWAERYYLDEQPATFALFTSISFDLTITSTLLPLITGNEIVTYSEENLLYAMEQIIHDKRVSILKLTPAQLKLIQYIEMDSSNIKTLIVGGEQLLSELARETYNKFHGQIEIFNEYGPTEATVGCMIHRFDIEKDVNIAVPIGIPIDNVNIYILDSNLKLVPENIIGEIYISGVSTSRGYLNDPVRTTNYFLPNPYKQGENMYKSGDLAKRTNEGVIIYAGRADRQVKIHGYRIEMGEVEATISRYPGIKEVIVVEKRDNIDENYLSAYFVSDIKIQITDLLSFLTQQLPKYMIPVRISQIDKIPLTLNGKVDLKYFSDIKDDLMKSVQICEPSNIYEERVLKIWKDILNQESISMDDNFFEIGGHSLNAMILAKVMQKEFNRDISLKQIYESPTISGLANYLKDTIEAKYSEIYPISGREYYPLSDLERIWYQKVCNSKADVPFNITTALRVKGRLDLQRVENALNKIICRHEIWRTTFETVCGEPVQRIHEDIDFHVDYQDVIEENIDKIIEEFVQPYDVSHTPLFRAKILKINTEHYIILFDIHHIISDGTSQTIMVKEFVEFYQGRSLPPLEIQYKDYSVWQHENNYCQRTIYTRDLFGEKLTPVLMQTDYPRPERRSYEGNQIFANADEKLTKQIKDIVTESHSTLFTVMLSAFFVLLYKYTGQEEIIMGSALIERPNIKLQPLMGVFVDTITLYGYPSGEKKFTDFLLEIKDMTLRVFEKPDNKYDLVGAYIDSTQSQGINPLFKSSDTGNKIMKINELSISEYEMKCTTTRNDLTFDVAEDGAELVISVKYWTKLFKYESMEKFLVHYLNILTQIVAEKDKKISDFQLLELGYQDYKIWSYDKPS